MSRIEELRALRKAADDAIDEAADALLDCAEALAPLAALAAAALEDYADRADESVMFAYASATLTLGDLRRAHAALAKLEGRE